MISGLVHASRCAEVLDLLGSSSFPKGGKDDGFDETMLVVLLQPCKKLDEAMCCRSVHAVAIRRLWFFLSSLSLLNALQDAYAKCGLLEHALRDVPRVARQERRHVEHRQCRLRPQRQAARDDDVLRRDEGGWDDSLLDHHAEHTRGVCLLRGNQSIEMRPWRGGQERASPRVAR